MTKLSELRKIAGAATPGESEWNTTEPASELWKSMKDQNSAFIRTFNPTQVLRLLDAIEVMREGLEQSFMCMADLSSRVKSPEPYMLADIKSILEKANELLGEK